VTERFDEDDVHPAQLDKVRIDWRDPFKEMKTLTDRPRSEKLRVKGFALLWTAE
jgi:hypothetical protein